MKINLTREQYVQRLDEGRKIIDYLMKLDTYFQKNSHSHSLVSDCDNVEIIISQDHNISIRVCTSRSESFKATNCIGMLHYQEIGSSNTVNPRWINYSPLNKTCRVAYFDEYSIEYPFIHDEALYFQNLTRHDLPEEFFYEESCKLLDEIKDLEIVSMNVSIGDLEEHHIKAIDKLIDEMDLN